MIIILMSLIHQMTSSMKEMFLKEVGVEIVTVTEGGDKVLLVQEDHKVVEELQEQRDHKDQEGYKVSKGLKEKLEAVGLKE